MNTDAVHLTLKDCVIGNSYDPVPVSHAVDHRANTSQGIVGDILKGNNTAEVMQLL